jgi:hypothetical protein
MDCPTQRVFNVAGFNNITSGMIWGTRLWLAGNAADNINGAIWSFQDTNNDGLLDEASGVKALESIDFAGGLTFGRNTAGGLPFVLNRSTGNLYRLEGITGGVPTSYSSWGRISSRTDIRDFAFSASGQYAYGVTDWDRPLTRGLRWSVGSFSSAFTQYQPWGDHYEPYNYSDLVPALGGKVRGGGLEIQITGTVGRQVTAYQISDTATPIGSIKLDPAGRGIFHLGNPLVAGHGLRFTDDEGLQSATYEIPASEPLRFHSPHRLRDGNVRFQAFGMPSKPHTVFSSSSLDAWQVDQQIKSSRFGSIFFIRDANLGNAFYGIQREDHPLIARSESYTLASGLRASFFLGYNDHARADSTWDLVGPTGYHQDLISLSTKGILDFGALADINRFQINYRLQGGGETSQVAQVTVYIDQNLLLNPPVQNNSLTGEPFVAVPCLVLGGLHYPAYQFALRNSPMDHCTQPHWHRYPGIALVFPLENPNAGIPDPDPDSCGFGTYQTVTQADFLQTPKAFNTFKAMHPRP